MEGWGGRCRRRRWCRGGIGGGSGLLRGFLREGEIVGMVW